MEEKAGGGASNTTEFLPDNDFDLALQSILNSSAAPSRPASPLAEDDGFGTARGFTVLSRVIIGMDGSVTPVPTPQPRQKNVWDQQKAKQPPPQQYIMQMPSNLRPAGASDGRSRGLSVSIDPSLPSMANGEQCHKQEDDVNGQNGVYMMRRTNSQPRISLTVRKPQAGSETGSSEGGTTQDGGSTSSLMDAASLPDPPGFRRCSTAPASFQSMWDESKEEEAVSSLKRLRASTTSPFANGKDAGLPPRTRPKIKLQVASGDSLSRAKQCTPPMTELQERTYLRAPGTSFNVVLAESSLFRTIMSFQDGVAASAYPSGDSAACCSHLSLLRSHEARGTPLRLSVAAPMLAAMSGGGPKLMSFICRHMTVQWPLPLIVLNAAIASADLATVRWVWERTVTTGELGRRVPGSADMAASKGRLQLLQWLIEAGVDVPSVAALDLAADGGHLSTMQWLVNIGGHHITPNTVRAAAVGGCVDCLLWLMTVADTLQLEAWQTALVESSGAGKVEVVECLADRMGTSGMLAVQMAMDKAVKAGHTDVALYLVRKYLR